MKADDLPALYGDADAASLRAQANFFRALIASLALLIFSATLATLQVQSPIVAGLQAVALLASLSLTIYIGQVQPQRIWYGTRALAESLKTVAWRYAMRAEPYDVEDTIARTRFISTAKSILDDNKLSSHAVAYTEGNQITDAMSVCRALDLAARKERYDTDRVKEQLDWYRKKAKYNDTRSRQWFGCLVALHGLAVLSALAKFGWPSLVYWPIGLLVAAASGLIAWLQTKRFQELAASYSLTAHEIGLLRAKLPNVNSETAFSQFVGDAENAFSREHTQWRARRDAS